MPSKSLVVFDLDGTLVDTAPDLAATMNVILSREGLGELAPASVRLMVGRGARVLMERGLDAAGVVPDTARLDRLVVDFLAVYEQRIALESRPFPGAVEAVEALVGNGALLAICTNKPERLSKLLLAELGLGEHFVSLIGGDSLTRRKPYAEPLLEAIARAGCTPAETVMVGDSVTDIQTARAAGVPVVGVSFGYSETPMGELGADAVIDHFDELSPAIAKLRERASPA
jgi:phosphoglycolate phosphatase